VLLSILLYLFQQAPVSNKSWLRKKVSRNKRGFKWYNSSKCNSSSQLGKAKLNVKFTPPGSLQLPPHFDVRGRRAKAKCVRKRVQSLTRWITLTRWIPLMMR
jgi:hypothetical protein